MEVKARRKQYCKLKEKEDNEKGVNIRKNAQIIKHCKDGNYETGEFNEYDEIHYLVEWEETVEKKKKKGHNLP